MFGIWLSYQLTENNIGDCLKGVTFSSCNIENIFCNILTGDENRLK